VDARARADALARGASDYEAWRASVTDRAAERVIEAREDGGAGMSVPEVALGVDTGRELAARALAEGAGVVVARAAAGLDDSAARAVAESLAADSEHGPLGTLRRLGDPTTAVLCGVALGAGEHGLGCVCEDVTALAGAAVAAGIEPDLIPRLRAVPTPETTALAARLGIAEIER
jgi:nicotinate-nucleotide--dimethylbenzimidazole phosphoribosyltransferase